MIPSSFYYDLSSVPRLFWWLVAPFELTMVGPLVHDFIYRNRGNSSLFSVNNNHQQISRSEADDIFNFIMQKEGIHPVRRIIAYYAVRLFGWLSW